MDQVSSSGLSGAWLKFRRVAARSGLAGILLACPILGQLQAPDSPTAYQVKAAFLLNFTKFIDWPGDEATDPRFPICVAGEDPFGRALDQIVEGESVNGAKLAVERVGDEVPKSCRVVFWQDE